VRSEQRRKTQSKDHIFMINDEGNRRFCCPLSMLIMCPPIRPRTVHSSQSGWAASRLAPLSWLAAVHAYQAANLAEATSSDVQKAPARPEGRVFCLYLSDRLVGRDQRSGHHQMGAALLFPPRGISYTAAAVVSSAGRCTTSRRAAQQTKSQLRAPFRLLDLVLTSCCSGSDR
jgi:hypothetical protein